MRSSSILCLMGAALVAANPVHNQLHKRAIEWDIVTNTVFVTVTAGASPSSKAPIFAQHTDSVEPVEPVAAAAAPTTSTSTPPPPPPTTSSTPPPPPPPATTSAAPAVEASPSPSAAPVKQVAKASSSSAESSSAESSSAQSTPAQSSAAAAPTGYSGSVLHYHNLHRTNHSAPAVEWNSTLAEYASTTADTCVFAHDMSQGTGSYGQNIGAVGSSNPVKDWDSSDVAAYSITDGWYYSEYENFASYYGNASPPIPDGDEPEYLHFTQVVWKGTESIGCATKYCDQNTVLSGSYGWYTVCNYFPEGNMEGSFDVDVSKSVDDASITVPFPS